MELGSKVYKNGHTAKCRICAKEENEALNRITLSLSGSDPKDRNARCRSGRIGRSNFKVKMALEETNTNLLETKTCEVLPDSSGWKKMPQVITLPAGSWVTSLFYHLEEGRGEASDDRLVAGEGQKTIRLNDKGHERANQQGNGGVG